MYINALLYSLVKRYLGFLHLVLFKHILKSTIESSQFMVYAFSSSLCFKSKHAFLTLLSLACYSIPPDPQPSLFHLLDCFFHSIEQLQHGT